MLNYGGGSLDLMSQVITSLLAARGIASNTRVGVASFCEVLPRVHQPRVVGTFNWPNKQEAPSRMTGLLYAEPFHRLGSFDHACFLCARVVGAAIFQQ
jgi:hypothetical protein